MQIAQRVIINTTAQYTRTIINILLSLFSTRLVLDALGKSDYGIFQLVGGVVAMLGFLTNALVITTQRHLSYAKGEGKPDEARKVFSTSLCLHVFLSIAFICILAALTPWLFSFLKIAPTSIITAERVYFVALFTLFLSFLVAPFRAVFIARENIVFISCIDVLDGVLKVLFVLFFLKLFPNRLLTYTFLMSALMLLNLLAFSIYSRLHYAEVRLLPSRTDVSWDILRRFLGFAGWTCYSIGCIVGRSQGIAIVLNRFVCNTIINTAYGLAMQVANYSIFISQAIINAMSPQIVKAVGSGNRARMLSLAARTSKYTFLLLSMVVIPIIVEAPQILDFWLGANRYPPETIVFCRIILTASICDQLTIGLGVANQAIGRIRNYSLIVNSIKLLTVPLFWWLLHNGYSIGLSLWCYVVMELICALVRLPFLKATAGLSIWHYLRIVGGQIIIPFSAIIIIAYALSLCAEFPLRFLVTGFLCIVTGSLAAWYFACDDIERKAIQQLVHYKKN